MAEVNPPTENSDASEFAPQDITDNRPPYDWATRWTGKSIVYMRWDAGYLLLCLTLGIATLSYQLYCVPVGNDPIKPPVFFLTAWSAGLIGGTSFSIKWFYHVCAKGLWHLDRRYWRFFSPIISSVLATFTTLLLYKEDLVGNTKPGLSTFLTISGTAFLAGYFSDNAFAKLAEIAKVLFGTTEKHRPSKKDDSAKSSPEKNG